MPSTLNSQTSWSDFWTRTGPIASPADSNKVNDQALSPEETREQQLSDRLTGPQGTAELVDRICSLKSPGTGAALLLSGGGGTFALQIAERLRHVVVVHQDPLVVEAMKARVLGSNASVANYLSDHSRDPDILQRHAIRPGIEYRRADLPRTSFGSESFETVIIEQGHEFGIAPAIGEAKRLLRKNGKIILLGYLPLKAVARRKSTKDEVLTKIVNEALEDGFDQTFRPFITPDEGHLLNAYQRMDFPFQDIALGNVHDEFRSRMFMHATWDLFTLHEFINTWPVVRRLTADESTHKIGVWHYINRLKFGWDSPRTRRTLNWPVAVRAGVKTADGDNDNA